MARPAAKAPAPSSNLIGRRLGRYEVLTQLASGGMATVYVARAQGVAGFERLVAIKVLHPHLAHDEDFISMFLDEARLAAQIRHPNVVGTLDISDTQGDGFFLVMEYVEGDHFGALLRQAAKGGVRLPVPVVARIVMDALTGLSAAHGLTDASGRPLEIVHRDISPHNILVGKDGVARITDFGVAKAQVRLSSTRDGQFKGKLSYMAPEQAASGQADQRSDLFSMGIVLWEALTGRRLFRGENNADVLNRILYAEVPPPSAFEAALAPFDAVAAKALARDPEERFQCADQFLEAVEEAAGQLGGVAMPRGVAREVTRWLGEKIAAEHAAIRNATDALGRSDVTAGSLPRPMEGGSQPSQPQSLVRPIAGDDTTLGAKPSTLPPPSRHTRTPWIVVAALATLLFLGGSALAIGFLLGTPSAGAPVASPPASPPQVAPAVAPPPVVSAPALPHAAPVIPQAAEPSSPTAALPSAPETNERSTEAVPRERHSETDEPRRPRVRRNRAERREAPRADDGDDEVLANPYSR